MLPLGLRKLNNVSKSSNGFGSTSAYRGVPGGVTIVVCVADVVEAVDVAAVDGVAPDVVEAVDAELVEVTVEVAVRADDDGS